MRDLTGTGKQTTWAFPSTGVIEAGQKCALRIVRLVDERWASRLTFGEEDMNGAQIRLELDSEADEKQMSWFCKSREEKTPFAHSQTKKTLWLMR